jgi:hypothetical protein
MKYPILRGLHLGMTAGTIITTENSLCDRLSTRKVESRAINSLPFQFVIWSIICQRTGFLLNKHSII